MSIAPSRGTGWTWERVAVRSALTLMSLLLAGCVYPATEPTGMELSWRFVEVHPADGLADGEQDPPVRTCEGAQTEQVAIEVVDQDTPARQGVFRFDCLDGYQTINALQTEASDAFVRLDPGIYNVAMRVVADASHANDDEQVDARQVEVIERGITIVPWEVSRAPVSWDLTLSGSAGCDSMTLALYYANPEIDLAEHVPDEEQNLPLYRQTLMSDRGLAVDGQAVGCLPERDGIHRFEPLDRGEYLLEIAVDGRVCALRVDLTDPANASSVIDLANLPCGG